MSASNSEGGGDGDDDEQKEIGRLGSVLVLGPRPPAAAVL